MNLTNWLETYEKHNNNLATNLCNKKDKEFVKRKNEIDRETCRRITNITYRETKNA